MYVYSTRPATRPTVASSAAVLPVRLRAAFDLVGAGAFVVSVPEPVELGGVEEPPGVPAAKAVA